LTFQWITLAKKEEKKTSTHAPNHPKKPHKETTRDITQIEGEWIQKVKDLSHRSLDNQEERTISTALQSGIYRRHEKL